MKNILILGLTIIIISNACFAQKNPYKFPVDKALSTGNCFLKRFDYNEFFKYEEIDYDSINSIQSKSKIDYSVN
jgi:hypothetical protein